MTSFHRKFSLNKLFKHKGNKSEEEKTQVSIRYDPSKPLRNNISSASSDKLLNEELRLFTEKVNLLFTLKSNKRLKSDLALGAVAQMRWLCLDKSDSEILEKLSGSQFKKYFEKIKKTQDKYEKFTDLSDDENIRQNIYSNQETKINIKKSNDLYSDYSLIHSDKTLEMLNKYNKVIKDKKDKQFSSKNICVGKTAWDNYQSPSINSIEMKNTERDVLREIPTKKNKKQDSIKMVEKKPNRTQVTKKKNIFIRFFEYLFSFLCCCFCKESKLSKTTIIKHNILNSLKHILERSLNTKTSNKEGFDIKNAIKLHGHFYKRILSRSFLNNYHLLDIFHVVLKVCKEEKIRVFNYKTTEILLERFHVNLPTKINFGENKDITVNTRIRENETQNSFSSNLKLLRQAIKNLNFFQNNVFLCIGKIIKVYMENNLIADKKIFIQGSYISLEDISHNIIFTEKTIMDRDTTFIDFSGENIYDKNNEIVTENNIKEVEMLFMFSRNIKINI